MAHRASYSGLCCPGLENEIYSPRARLIHDNYLMAPFDTSRRVASHQPLSEHIAGDYGVDGASWLQRQPLLDDGDDPAAIDREGPYGCNPLLRQYRSHAPLYDDADYLGLSDSGRRFPYTYPLPCMEPGGIRWSLNQIHAYNREVLRRNSLIARGRSLGPPAEYLMLYPMMDSRGRFPPGFDRPMRMDDFLFSDEPVIDSHRLHYGLPVPETLERLLLLNSTERQLKRQLKKVQLLEFYGAHRLAEQLSLQLLAVQNALPGLSVPQGLGHGLGPEFDETFLSPMTRPSNSLVPVDAIGYGNGLANWNGHRRLRRPESQMWSGSVMDHPWTRSSGHYPGPSLSLPPPPGMDRNIGFHDNWPGMSYGSGGDARWGDHGRSHGIHRDLERISCDGGRGRRAGRFN